MPIVAKHHVWKDKDHTPDSGWPEDCYVQWGGAGVVLGKDPYRTAFFEAFPKEGGFIRGEGETIRAAEQDALAQYHKKTSCPEHAWSRRNYLNGGAFCRRCGAFESVMRPVVKLGEWKRRLSSNDLNFLMMGALRRPDGGSYERRIQLRLSLAGVKLPDPEGMDDEAYEEACHESVMSWLHRIGGPDNITPRGDEGGEVQGLFNRFALNTLRRDYEAWKSDRT